ncbi:alpha/beta fold hydrolase [Streptomyces sp. NBC_01235]|uniref:alpha/beta fold hydrolase n=1 Tax=Streptomyces sp. NBC_01235 TaxID=2903788 RepID=UPI002E102BD2|nr:alpha/beta hydrolase [Streptomyces sp. NBC_01235]
MSGIDVVVRRMRAATHERPVRALALHGLAATGTTWNAYGQHAAPDVELWTAELPWGQVGAPGWSLPGGDPADWIGAAMDKVPGGVDVLIAHSYSALLALEHLAAAPPQARPGALVVVSPFHRRDPADFHWDTARHYLSIFQDVFDEALCLASTRPLDPGMRHDMALLVRDRVGPYGWFRFYDSYLRSPFLDTAALDLPVLAVAGRDDRFAPPEDAAALAETLPRGRLCLLDDCGHFPMAEQPRGFADAVHAFVSESVTSAGVN